MNEENFEREQVATRSGSSPAFKAEYLNDFIDARNGVMTISGTINKTAICLLLVVLSALYTWNLSSQGFTDMVGMLWGVSFFTALILGFVIIFNRKSTAIKYMVPIYALAEGSILGAVSFIFEKYYPGVVQMAIEGTLFCIALMLGLYKFNVIKVTDKLRSAIILSTLTIAGIYLIDILLSLFGIRVPMINSASTFGIVFSIVVVGIASFNLLLDFDFIEQASQRMFPKHIEWYGAFGLMVTIVWLYMEILKLLAKMQSRR